MEALAPEATPVPVGSPVKTGVVRVGEEAKTNTPPLPVSSVTAEDKFAEDGVARKVATPVPSPEIPVETGRPVALVKTNVDGVPKFGVTKVGEVENTRLVLVVPVVPVAAFK